MQYYAILQYIAKIRFSEEREEFDERGEFFLKFRGRLRFTYAV
jgi:hypothetical protein